MTNPPSTAPDGATADSGGKLSVSEVLSKAADLIEPEGAWTQKAWARDAGGRSDPGPGEAVCWCLFGAIHVASAHAGARVYREATDAIRRATDDNWIGWNDAPGRTQAEVIAALRKAAEQAREAGQ